MFKVAAVVWIMLATTLAGVALLVVVTVPKFASDAQFLIPVACGAAVIAALPLSYIVAYAISRPSAG